MPAAELFGLSRAANLHQSGPKMRASSVQLIVISDSLVEIYLHIADPEFSKSEILSFLSSPQQPEPIDQMKILPLSGTMHLPRTNLRPSLLALAVVAVAISSASAQTTRTWDDGAGNATWDTTSVNWSGNTWTAGDSAAFGATGVGTITVDGTQSVQNINITAAGYNFSGGTLNVANKTATNTWTIGGSPTISSDVVADFAGEAAGGLFVKNGGGPVTFSGDFSFTGRAPDAISRFDVTQGAVTFSGNSSFVNGRIFISGGSVNYTAGTHTFTSGASPAATRGITINNNSALTVAGGAVTTDRFIAGFGSDSAVTVSSGSLTVIDTSNGIDLAQGGLTTRTSDFNLNGGTVVAKRIAVQNSWLGTATINLDGGTFISNSSEFTHLFRTDGTQATSQVGQVLVQNGGAIIDTAGGFNATQTQALEAGVGSTGGLTKLGNGTLTLLGANTYIGNTTITAGPTSGGLDLASTGELRMLIAGNGINTQINGNGALTLDGALRFDLTGAGTTFGDSWSVVTVDTLVESFGGTFQALSTLGSFTNDSGLWTITENGVDYQFSQSTGYLTVIPEPGTWALLIGGFVLLIAMRRRFSMRQTS